MRAISRKPIASGAAVLSAVLMAASGHATSNAAPTGTIEGRVHLTGVASNSIIRMGADPQCAEMNRGKRILQEAVVVSGGGLVNVFVNVLGSFPATPVPDAVIALDQQGCVYRPRILGARVGQTLRITNDDPVLHNLHGLSLHGNDFNASQPKAGMVFTYQLKTEEVLLHIKCDIHSWMTAYIGVVDNPYFDVSGDGGAFTIGNVPAGKQTVQAWHEKFGTLSQTVDVKAGETTTVEFSYSGSEKGGTPSGFARRELTLPF